MFCYTCFDEGCIDCQPIATRSRTITIGIAEEAIEPGDWVEVNPATGQLRKARPALPTYGSTQAKDRQADKDAQWDNMFDAIARARDEMLIKAFTMKPAISHTRPIEKADALNYLYGAFSLDSAEDVLRAECECGARVVGPTTRCAFWCAAFKESK